MTEHTMPRSVLHHRPMDHYSSIDPITSRARKLASVTKGKQTSEPPHTQWSWPFFTGLFLTFAILLIGQIRL